MADQPSTIVNPKDFYLLDVSTPLPSAEVKRRHDIGALLKQQFEYWQTHEQKEYAKARDASNTRFSHFTDLVRAYERRGSTNTTLPGLSQLLSASTTSAFFTWLNEQRRYAVHISDVSTTSRRQYCMPLIYLAQKPDYDKEQLQDLTCSEIQSFLPHQPQHVLRLVQFPQTRLSFLSDEIFKDLYPTELKTLWKITFNFRKRLLQDRGYYNSCIRPFFDNHEAFDRDQSFSFSFPIIEFEQLDAFTSRKTLERAIAQFSGDTQILPSITRWKYLRRFDSANDPSPPLRGGSPTESQSSVHSARGLNEYLFPSFETLQLDHNQSVIQQQQNLNLDHPQQLLSVDSIWLIGFKKSETIILLRNSTTSTSCEHEPIKLNVNRSAPHMIQVIESIIGQDHAYTAYEPFFRSRLAYMQYHVRFNTFNEQLEIVQGLNDLVAELNAIIKILQAQIFVLSSLADFFHLQSDPMIFELRQRKEHEKVLLDILSHARVAQDLYFQLTSTETARRQAILAKDMKLETHQQLKLARKGDTRNKAILAFTIITIIFLPLSFFTSYFGMNTSDIRTLNASQGLYWTVAGPSLVLVILIVCIIAFSTRVGRFLRLRLSTSSAAGQTDHRRPSNASYAGPISMPSSTYGMDPESQGWFGKNEKRS